MKSYGKSYCRDTLNVCFKSSALEGEGEYLSVFGRVNGSVETSWRLGTYTQTRGALKKAKSFEMEVHMAQVDRERIPGSRVYVRVCN